MDNRRKFGDCAQTSEERENERDVYWQMRYIALAISVVQAGQYFEIEIREDILGVCLTMLGLHLLSGGTRDEA